MLQAASDVYGLNLTEETAELFTGSAAAWAVVLPVEPCREPLEPSAVSTAAWIVRPVMSYVLLLWKSLREN